MDDKQFQPLSDYIEYPPAEMEQRAAEYLAAIRRRRSVRDFSDRPVARIVIEDCIRAAGTAPNGANLQPWHFAIVESAAVKNKIRVAAEREEYEFYHGKAPQAWLDTLAPLGTDESKPFLETAPFLIVVFSRSHETRPDGSIVKQYYPTESTGIATGFLISALHHAGLATLTHTPSPMKFLNEILNRPSSERPFVLLVVGYPAENTRVPVITKKTLDQITTWH